MKYVEGFTAGEKSTTPMINISTSDLIHFSGNWVWRAVEALVQAKDFQSNPVWIADRLNITVESAKDALEGLHRIGLVETRDAVVCGKKELLNFDSNQLERSDLFNIHSKIRNQISDKVTSRDCYSNVVFLSSKKNIAEFYEKFCELVEELNSKSVNHEGSPEVFGLELTVARLSREKV